MAKYIQVSNGYLVNYDYASPDLKQRADRGELLITDNPNPTAQPPTSPTPTPSPSPAYQQPAVDRTQGIGLLQKAKAEAEINAQQQQDIQRQADDYAAQIRQARIDAINQAFTPKIQREEQAGQERLSRVSALNFNRGLVGSGVDTTFTGEQKSLNAQALQSIEQEKAALINEAFGYADKLGAERRQQLTEETKGRATANVQKYQDQYDRAVQAIQLFGKSGTTLEDLQRSDPDTLQTLREVGGFSDAQIVAMLDHASPTPSNVDRLVAGNIIVTSYYDPKTKQFKSYQEKLDIPQGTKSSDIQVLTDSKTGLFYAYDKVNNKVINTFGTARPQGGASDFTDQEQRKLEQAGLGSAERQKQLNFLYGEEGGQGDRFLTPDYFRSRYNPQDLQDTAKEAGYRNIDDYLNFIMSQINQYRLSGYNDKEILKQMQ